MTIHQHQNSVNMQMYCYTAGINVRSLECLGETEVSFVTLGKKLSLHNHPTQIWRTQYLPLRTCLSVTARDGYRSPVFNWPRDKL